MKSTRYSRSTVIAIWAVFPILAILVFSVSPAHAEFGYLDKWGSGCSVNDEGLDGCDGQFGSAGGIAIDDEGSIYVADSSNNRIEKFSSNGEFLDKWGSYCSVDDEGLDGCDGQFDYPRGVAVDREGYVYVADTRNDRIQKFTSDGKYLVDKWGSNFCSVYDEPNVNCDGQFAHPRGLAVDGDGDVYVADWYNSRVQKLSKYGDFLDKWGSACVTTTDDEDNCDGEFYYPYDVAVDKDGNAFVADAGNSRIEKFSSNGEFLDKWGSYCSVDDEGLDGCDGKLANEPEAVSVDSGGNVYVADGANNRIEKFSSNGEFLDKWGSYCRVYDEGLDGCNGQFGYPRGVAVDREDDVFVVDSANSRIQKFGEVPKGGSDSKSENDSQQSPNTTNEPTSEPAPEPTPEGSTTDTIAPTIDSFKATRKRLHRPFLRKKKIKTVTVKLSLSEDAKVKVRVLSKKKRKYCKKKGKGKKTCKRSRLIAKRSFEGKSGDNKPKLRIASRYLKRGLYRLDAVATDAAGNRSKRAKTRLRVVR